MAVFLIQVSGGESTHNETSAEYWWEEPIKEGVYINYDWKMRGRMGTWEKVSEGDRVLIYCTGGVDPYPKQISHIATVTKVELGEEKAVMHLEVRKLRRGVPLEIISEKVESGELSEGMGKCGTQGFNIGEVEESDLEEVREWSESTEVREGIEVSREQDLHKYFRKHPEKIEDGLKIIEEPNEVLPEGAGIPDLVCIDKEGNYVVVEFKAGESGYAALGQLTSYKGAVRKKTGKKVRGVLIAHDWDSKITFATEIVDSDGVRLVEFKKYQLSFDLED
jgi:hypothetical protein